MKNVLLIFALVMFVSCAEKRKKPVFYGYDTTDTQQEVADYASTSGGDIPVHFEEHGGVKYVDVKVNGVGLQMIFDTGCSGTLISIAEARYLYNKGLLTESDVLGTVNSQIADGSIVENLMVILREVIVDDKIICENVKATVSSNIEAPLLLGNEILDRASSYTIDNTDKIIHFKLK